MIALILRLMKYLTCIYTAHRDFEACFRLLFPSTQAPSNIQASSSRARGTCKVSSRSSLFSSLFPLILSDLFRFAHLISVDFFRDLLEAMKQVMNSGNTLDSEEESNISAADTRRRLLCSITAFQLLSGQGKFQ